MAKLPYMQFYPSDYQADVRCLPMATQGAWMQILCVLWRSKHRGKKTLTLEEWSRELGCQSSELSLYLMTLEHHEVGKISRECIENVEQITISCKRIMREKMKQSLALKRKQKQRVTSMSRECHANVTDLSQQSHAEESESESESEIIKEKKEKREKTPAPLALSEVMSVWNETPGVRTAQSITGPIKKIVERRIQEHPDLQWFSDLFQRVSQSDFLTGRSTDFAATLDWVLGPKNLAKIENGNYDNRDKQPKLVSYEGTYHKKVVL